MEELRSTEILDREIQDDARRKAEKILKGSDAECRQILDEVDSRIEKTKAAKKAEYLKRLEAYRRDSESAIPLEKQRRLVSFIDGSVNEALEDWFSRIGDKRRLEIFAGLLEGYRKVTDGRWLRVSCAGYTEGAVMDTVVRVFGKEAIVSVTAVSASRAAELGFSDGIYIETDDGAISCRATLEEIRSGLLSTRREELAKALLGGRLPE